MSGDQGRDGGNTPYWEKTRRLTALLLGGWLVLTFGTIFFARELGTWRFFGWPLSFYLLAQGAILLYALLIAVYAWYMDKLDRLFRKEDTHVE